MPMPLPRKLARSICAMLAVSIAGLTVPMGAANAAMVTTPAIIADEQTRIDRDQLLAALDRADIQEKLTSLGVDPDHARERVAALTPQEIEELNGRMAEMPAGGDAVGIILLIFLILLITDLVGVTDVFPFVKKGRR